MSIVVAKIENIFYTVHRRCGDFLMILSNLSTILGKKKLKIADLVKNTTLTRPTLTALYWNTGKGINFDTLESLCRYLKITPGELLSFYDVDIADIIVSYTSITEDEMTVDDDYNSIPYISSADFNGYIEFKQKHLGKIKFSGYLSCYNTNNNFSASLTWHCTRSFYYGIGSSEVLDFIDDKLYESLLDNFPESINNIDSIVYFYADEK